MAQKELVANALVDRLVSYGLIFLCCCVFAISSGLMMLFCLGSLIYAAPQKGGRYVWVLWGLWVWVFDCIFVSLFS